jgi:AmmeMemoRadiSam system protein B
VVALLDGEHSLLDIQAELTARSGRLVYSDDIRAIVQRLDEAYLLETDRFHDAFRRKVVEYRKKPHRESSHAGISYNDDPDALQAELEAFFTGPRGPGRPDFFSDDRRPLGIIAPHIDMRSGGNCFAHAYYELASGKPSDLYVIFGTGHAGVERLFTATNLDFQTPLGKVETDREFLAELERELGADPAAEEILHAKEHVIEFQVIFLQYLFSGRHEFKIVPVLTSLSHLLFGDHPAFGDRRELFDRFCAALREVCRSRSVCFVASADLDHIGPRYGDSFVPHAQTVTDSLEKDRDLMSCLERLDVDAFIQGVAAGNDSRRICGFSPITAMLHCMDPKEGRLLDLDFAYVDDKRSFVSFASMIFH